MAGYYFIISAMPSLQLGKAEMSFKEFKELLALNLSEKDMGEVEKLLRPIDLYNIRALWLGAPLDDRGNFDAKELEEKLLTQEALPTYLIDFLQRYDSIPERLRYFSILYTEFFLDMRRKTSGFLAEYFAFERELKLVLTALRAKEMKKDIVRELQFEDPTDLLVADILAQKDATDYVPPIEYEDVKNIFSDNKSDPRKLELAILQYKLAKIEEMEEMQDFGIDRVLNIAARLLVIEEIARQDPKKGMERLSHYA